MICCLLVFTTKEIEDVETKAARSRGQGEGGAGGAETLSELASRFDVHPTMINQWKPALLGVAPGGFERGSRKPPVLDEGQIKELHARIGDLAVASSFLEKS